MLSTLPLFYIAQSVDSDDRRARFQGLRVIMHCKKNYYYFITLAKGSCNKTVISLGSVCFAGSAGSAPAVPQISLTLLTVFKSESANKLIRQQYRVNVAFT